MKQPLLAGVLLLSALAPLQRARAQAVTYTDEASYLADLAALGLSPVHEGFEDDADWGGVRTTIAGGTFTAPSVHAQGLTWSANNANSGITTGPGPARSGAWGFFQLPHGDPANGINDGFLATGDQPLVAVGGWLRANGSAAKMELRLDGVAVDFGGPAFVPNQHTFLGAIDPGGFSEFEYIDLEGVPEDWRIVFADDFTFAFGGEIVDCNQNGVADPTDIGSGTSADCNANGLPDECEIAAGGGAPGGPWFCATGCAVDCNDNGVPDDCEAVVPSVFSSGAMSPFGDGSPQTFTVVSPPPTLADALLDLRAVANLGGSDEYVEVRLNGALVGTAFVNGADDCPESGPSSARIVVPRGTFEALVAGGDASIALLASTEVDAGDCGGAAYVEVDLTLFVPSPLDADGDGVLDACAPFPATCFCDAAAAPCGNDDPNAGCRNSTGLGARLAGWGSASLAAQGADPLVLSASGARPGKTGLWLQGTSGAQGPFRDGLLCVAGSTLRLPPTNCTDGSPFGAPLPLQIDAAGRLSTDDPLQGFDVVAAALCKGDDLAAQLPATRHYQLWFRDGMGPCGSGSNLTNAVEVTWTP